MKRILKNLIFISLLSLIPTVIIWIPFFLKLKSIWGIPLPNGGMATIVSNYDGPLFIVIAKTFYNIAQIKANYSFPLPTEYYAAHFPLFPVIIKIFAFIFGFPYGMLVATLISSILAIYFFNKLIRRYVEEKEALWITFVFCLFPARWLVVRSVGSAEPLFLAAIIASVYYFQSKKYWQAGVWGAIAQLTKSPGILLFIAYLGVIMLPQFKRLATEKFQIWARELNWKAYPILFIPISLLGIFVLYKFTFNDFFAYFHSGDNVHLMFPPFSIFNSSQSWVGTFWLEEVIFVYLFGILGLLQLIKQRENILAAVVGVFFTSLLFVAHRDLIRYSLPIVPFLFVAFANVIIKKEFKIVMAILALPIFLFSISYISQNVMPIGNWSPFL